MEGEEGKRRAYGKALINPIRSCRAHPDKIYSGEAAKEGERKELPNTPMVTISWVGEKPQCKHRRERLPGLIFKTAR